MTRQKSRNKTDGATNHTIRKKEQAQSGEKKYKQKNQKRQEAREGKKHSERQTTKEL